MTKTFDLLILDSEVVHQTAEGRWVVQKSDIGITDGRIQAIGSLSQKSASKLIKAKGLTAFPGFIDTQVHFREPGLDHKEDFLTGSGAAVLGGVTSVFDMPNTKPALLTLQDLEHKLAIAKNRFWCDYAFYLGANIDNYKTLASMEDRPGVCGVKVFLGPSTGHLVLNDEHAIRYLLSHIKKNIAFHCEDEKRLLEREHIIRDPKASVAVHCDWRDEGTAFLATEFISRLAHDLKRHVHILHVTSKKEIEFLKTQKDYVSVEVTPQHLTLSAPECYEALGTLAQMNPPIRTSEHREALWNGIADLTVDVIGSDHAPHTLQEKQKKYPDSPSGMTGVQTIAPLMIHHALNGKLSLYRVAELLCKNPAEQFGIQDKGKIAIGKFGDICLVDLKATTKITNEMIYSKCKWTPFDGQILKGKVHSTILRGNPVMQEGKILGEPKGEPLQVCAL
jgi:dihydroorotase